MVSPFGRPTLHLFSTTSRNCQAIARALSLFIGESVPHRFGAEQRHVAPRADDVFDVLDALPPELLRQTACIVDLSGFRTELLWDMPVNAQPLGALALPLRYPEVFWLYLVEEVPIDSRGALQPWVSLHWHTFDDVAGVLSALRRHAVGFRTWFDPTGLRGLCTNAIRSVEASLRKGSAHSAPFWAQAMASAMVRRATLLRERAFIAEDAIHGALLALDAWALLEGKTLALCLESLKLIHELEVLAECSFVGTAPGLHVGRRFVNLEAMVEILQPERRRTRPPGPFIPRPIAAAVDEEERFVMLNGYVLYRHGWRSYVVASEEELRTVLGAASNVQVVLEDVDLQFVDATRTEAVNLRRDSDVERTVVERSRLYEGLQKVQARVFISSLDPKGGPATEAIAALTRTTRYGGGNDGGRSGPLFAFVAKPHGGVFDPNIDAALKAVAPTNADPPAVRSAPDTHSMWRNQRLYALMSCADGLVNIYRSYNQYQESEEALSMSRGYESASLLSPRLGRFFSGISRRTESIARVVPRPVKRWLRDVLHLVSGLGLAYSTALVRSVGVLLAVTAGWVVAFAVLIWALSPRVAPTEALEYMGLLFLELQPPAVHGIEPYHWIVWLALLVAYVHLGLLIALFVDRVVRRA